MDHPLSFVTRITNDTEESFSYEKDGIRTNLSILAAAGDDPVCICRAQYQDGIEKPLEDEKLHIDSEEKHLLSELLKQSRFL